MKLLTHNLIQCNKVGCDNGYPLAVRIASEEELRQIQEERLRHGKGNETDSLNPIEFVECPFNADSVRGVLKRIDWETLVPAAQSVGINLPLAYNDDDINNDMFLKAVHKALNEFHLLEGSLVCPSCSHVYLVRGGIPDMVHEENVEAKGV